VTSDARLPRFLLGLAADERGAAIVEFTIVLPFLLGLFVLITEGGRVMWYHQLITKGVRDAGRYLSLVATDAQLCPAGGGTGSFPEASLANARNLALRGSPSGSQALLNSIWSDPSTLTASISCVANTGNAYHGPARIPVVTVNAAVPVSFPLVRAMALLGGSPATTLTFRVVTQARHYDG
jgi:TadE-like protein